MKVPITTSKYFVVCAAITISCKLHDNYRQPDKIAMTACQIKNPHKKIDEQSSVFWHWRDQLLYREELMLKTLNFDLNLDLPYELRDGLIELPEFNEASEEAKADDDGEGEKDVKSLVGEIDEEVEEEVLPENQVKDTPDAPFYKQGKEILKQVVSLIEILASLPILVAYNVEVFFGAALIMILFEKSLDPLPKGFLAKVGTTAEESYKCYKYIYELLRIGTESKDVQLISNKAASKRVKFIEKDDFFKLANTNSS